jgi:hypothetical protein
MRRLGEFPPDFEVIVSSEAGYYEEEDFDVRSHGKKPGVVVLEG